MNMQACIMILKKEKGGGMGDKGLYSKRPDFLHQLPSRWWPMTMMQACMLLLMPFLPYQASPGPALSLQGPVVSPTRSSKPWPSVFECMIMQNHHIQVITLINDRHYGVWIHDIITTSTWSPWSMIIITGCGSPLTMQYQVLSQLRRLLGW